MIHARELIRRKRDGEELAPGELSELVGAFTRGDVPDHQMAAFLMAVCFRGLSAAETFALTDAMIDSGERLDLASELGRRVVDKHSTGGVGDKTSIAVAPIVAACGVPFAKMSGRGLGHTGGTLDKLESIPGFRTELSRDAFVEQVGAVGAAIVGQSRELVPADKRLYALRDATSTVDEPSLIAASVMSKKIAAGASGIVLDVKVGDGAFVASLPQARALASTMVEIARRAARDIVCVLSDMNEPLGEAVGNALEVREAVAVLEGAGSAELRELVATVSAHLLTLSDLGLDLEAAQTEVRRVVESGAAREAYDRWVRAQGGDPDLGALVTAGFVREVECDRDGFVARVGAREIGQAVFELGAGRRTESGTVDHAVGVELRAGRGDRVRRGDVLGRVHARTLADAKRAEARVLRAYEIAAECPGERSVVLDVVR